MTQPQAPAIRFDAATRTWTLDTRATSYALRIAEDRLRHVYWGPRLPAGALDGVDGRGRNRDEVVGE